MLDIARTENKNAKIICSDFQKEIPEINNIKFDLITAFRFFPNAEHRLRDNGMKYISSKLQNDGILICNNHRNFWSIPYFMKRLFFLGGSEGMTNGQMIDLANKNSLELLKTYSIGILPQGEKKSLIPWIIVEKIETLIFKLTGKHHNIGYNVIFVFKKKNNNEYK